MTMPAKLRTKLIDLAKQTENKHVIGLIHSGIRAFDQNKINGDTEKAARSLEICIRTLAQELGRFPSDIAAELEQEQ